MNKRNFSRLSVIVIGDIMLDRSYIGRVCRLSPEAPVPVLTVDRQTDTLGGAANVARNCATLGAQTLLVGSVGVDAAGKTVRKLMHEDGIIGRYVSEHLWPTVQKIRSSGQYPLLRADIEPHPSVYDACRINPLVLKPLVQNSDVIIISDYAKGYVTDAIIEVVRTSKRRCAVFAIDPKPKHGLDWRGADVLTPNAAEALEMSGIHFDGHSLAYPTAAVIAAIRSKYAPKALAITRGAGGVTLAPKRGAIQHFGTTAKALDVCGCGDTFIAVMALMLALGSTAAEAAAMANHAAGVAVACPGTATVYPQDLVLPTYAKNNKPPVPRIKPQRKH